MVSVFGMDVMRALYSDKILLKMLAMDLEVENYHHFFYASDLQIYEDGEKKRGYLLNTLF
jgi:hypothetical protein